MIRSFDEMRRYQKADLRMHGRARLTVGDLLDAPQIRWVWLLRVGEYVANCWTSEPLRSVGRVVRLLIRRNGYRYGFSIPTNVFGPGLRIFHPGPIVVSSAATVGERCSIHNGVVIGHHIGRTSAGGPGRMVPVIGDNVFIGPGAKVFGRITIGDDCMIGANAVVTHDVEAGSLVHGVPARRAGDSVAKPQPPILTVLDEPLGRA